MKFSNFFSPTLKNVPAEAEIISHQLMIRSGMIKQSSAGIYSWLPLGLRVLKNIENIVRDEQNKRTYSEWIEDIEKKSSGNRTDLLKALMVYVKNYQMDRLQAANNAG